MEEQKKNQEIPYEDLKKVAIQLQQERNTFAERLQMAEKALATINSLDYLLKVIEIVHTSKNNCPTFSEDFILSCIKKAEDIMSAIFKEEKIEDTKDKEA